MIEELVDDPSPPPPPVIPALPPWRGGGPAGRWRRGPDSEQVASMALAAVGNRTGGEGEDWGRWNEALIGGLEGMQGLGA